MSVRAKEQLSQKPVGNVALVVYKAKTADQSYTTQTALQDDTDLQFSIDVNEVWVVRFVLDVGAALATPGMKASIAVPASSTVNVVAALTSDVQTAANQVVKRSSTASATLTFAAANLASVGDGLLEIFAYIKCSTTAGTVKFQFCQATSSGTAITVRAGSWMEARKLVF